MSFLARIKHLLGAGGPPAEVRSGRPEDTGGSPQPTATDSNSSTGTTPNDTFVGRAGGDDQGYLETGAERRAAEDEDRPDTHG